MKYQVFLYNSFYIGEIWIAFLTVHGTTVRVEMKTLFSRKKDFIHLTVMGLALELKSRQLYFCERKIHPPTVVYSRIRVSVEIKKTIFTKEK